MRSTTVARGLMRGVKTVGWGCLIGGQINYSFKSILTTDLDPDFNCRLKLIDPYLNNQLPGQDLIHNLRSSLGDLIEAIISKTLEILGDLVEAIISMILQVLQPLLHRL